MDKFESLRTIPLFNSLNDNELKKIVDIVKEKGFDVNYVVFRENIPGDAMYVIKDGSVKIVKNLGEGREKTLSFLGKGEFFGEMAILDGSPRSASAIVVESATLWIINKDDFMNLLISDGPLAVKFFLTIIKVFSERLRQTDENFKNLLLKYVQEGKNK